MLSAALASRDSGSTAVANPGLQVPGSITCPLSGCPSVAPRLPVCSALLSFCDDHLLLRKASPGPHIPGCGRGRIEALSEVWGLVAYIPGPGGPAPTGLMVWRSQ